MRSINLPSGALKFRNIIFPPRSDPPKEVVKTISKTISSPQSCLEYAPLSQQEIEIFLNLDIPQLRERGPFGSVIGQDKAVRRLKRIAGTALATPEHRCATNILFEGPSSVGKTHLARVFAEKVLMLPLVELDATVLANKKSAKQEILDEVGKVCDQLNLPLVEIKENFYCLPPIVIFIDEAQTLPKDLQDALLKATERKDHMLVTDANKVVDCKNVCWILATTHRGQLREAFDNRFKKIQLHLYSEEEVAKIVQLNFSQLDARVCSLIAHYNPRVPREALDFAEEVKAEKIAHPEITWDQAASNVASDAEIDQFGMTFQRLNILRALGQHGPMSLSRLCGVAQCEEETLRARVLPPLLTTLPNEPSLVDVAHRHFITGAGLQELDKRKIKHLGKKAMPEDYLDIREEN